MELLEHNAEAYNGVNRIYEHSNRAAVVHPTGTGKSYIGLKLIDDNPGKKVLYVAPSNTILMQIKDNARQEKVSFVDTERTTYQKLAVNEEYLQSLKDIDIIILDEFHHCGAQKWGKAIEKLISNNPQAKILGLSATPIRYCDEKIRDMGEELFGDNIASEMTLAEAIEKGIIREPDYTVGIYESEEIIKELEEKYERLSDTQKARIAKEYESKMTELRKMLSSEVQGLPELLKEKMKNRQGKYVVYCKNIEDMKKKMEQAQEIFGQVNQQMEIMSVSSERKEGESNIGLIKRNKRTLDRFEKGGTDGKLQLLFCVDMLNEGYHLKDIDGIVMMRPTHSPTLYDQQLGRGLSIGGKDTVIIDLVDNLDSIEIIRGFGENLQERGIGEHKAEEKPFPISGKTEEIRKIANTIDSLFTREKLSYEDKFNIMKKFMEETGEEITRDTKYCGYSIGRWKSDLLTLYNKGELQIGEELLQKFIDEGIIYKINRNEQTIIAQTLEIAEKLKNAGVNLSKIKLSKVENGRQRRLLLNEINQKGINIAQIINDEDLDGNFPFGNGIAFIRQACKGTGTYAITEEQKRLSEELGLVQKEKKSTVAETLEIAKILKDNGVDFSKIQLTQNVNGEKESLLLKDVTQKGVNIEEIIKINDLDGNFPLGKRIRTVRDTYNGKLNCSMTEEQRRLAEKLGLIPKKEKSVVAKTLEIAKILKDSGVDLSKIVLSKQVNGKKISLSLEEIDLTKEGLDIAKIIKDNGLDGNFRFGKNIEHLRTAYNGTGTHAITEEEKRLAEELGLVQKEKKSAVEETLEIAKILKDSGVDLSQISLTKKENGKDRRLLLREIEQDGVDIAQIIKDNKLDGNFKFGNRVQSIRLAYNGKRTSAMTEEQRRLAEKLGLIPKKEKSAVAETLEIAQILKDNGVDLSKIQLTKSENGKSRRILLKEIEQEGIDIKTIIESNNLDENFSFGMKMQNLRTAYNGTGTYLITEAEKRLAEELGLVRIRSGREIADATGGDVLNNVEQADTINGEFSTLIEQDRRKATLGEFQNAEGAPGDGEAPGQE